LGDPEAVEPAVAWLEEDHFCRWSGYRKERIMRYLARSPLTAGQAERLRRLLARVATRGRRQDLRDACRLARHLDSPEWRAELRSLVGSEISADSKERATRMLRACERPTPRRYPPVD
jgi:hypothetical protein